MTTKGSERRVAVIGFGAWGRALALHASRQCPNVIVWTRSQSEIEKVLAAKSISIGQATYPLPPQIEMTNDLEKTGDVDFAIIALPAKAWSAVVPRITAKTVVSATKGLETSSVKTPLDYLEEVLGRKPETTAVISGPSFASDLAAGRPLSIVAASKSLELAQRIAESLSGPTMRVYTSLDPLGVELGGILKNVMAIAAGVSDALGLGPSARAGILSRGLAEMVRVATAMGADSRTLFGLSGLGDLIMTATEDQSRNRTVGLRLGRGETIEQITSTLGSTAEGVVTAPLVKQRADALGIDAPITNQVVRLLAGTLEPKEIARELMTRPLKGEF